MADFPSSTWSVHPTENDIYGSEGIGAGRVINEFKLTQAIRGGVRRGHVISGFTLPSSGSRTAVSVAGGYAVIDGYTIYAPSALTISINNNVSGSTNARVWLQLVSSANKATVIKIVTVYTDAQQNNAILLGRLTTDATNVTAMEDNRSTGRILYGACTTAGATVEAGSGDWRWDSHPSTGVTRYQTDTAFIRAPNIIMASCTSGVLGFATGGAPNSTTKFEILTYDLTGGAADKTHSFIVIC
jgi:hypothetical protein